MVKRPTVDKRPPDRPLMPISSQLFLLYEVGFSLRNMTQVSGVLSDMLSDSDPLSEPFHCSFKNQKMFSSLTSYSAWSPLNTFLLSLYGFFGAKESTFTIYSSAKGQLCLLSPVQYPENSFFA